MEVTPSAKHLFSEAQQIADPKARALFLAAECGSDTALLRRVNRLLGSAEKAGDFLETPPTPFPERTRPNSVADAIDDQSGTRIGRYRLLEKIGEGGCGVVYMAEQEEPVRRRVALKIIKLGMDTRSVIARFEAERQALALMDHPNIAKVLDGGATSSGRPYFVMELVRGLRFTEFCLESDLSIEARLRLFLKVCHAVQHAHQKGVIHRDLKPSNILVTINDGVPVPKVIDFGIAKAIGQRLTDKTVFTQFLSFIGTPAYVSPEQAEMSSVDVDTRSDIYSLGVLLYELLTGRTPFDGEELMRAGLDAMRRTIREQQPATPSLRLTRIAAEAVSAPGLKAQADSGAIGTRWRLPTKDAIYRVRGDLDWIVMKCLEKDRARRYATANGLAADVERHLEHEPILARPPSALYRFRKMVRRNRVAFGAIAAMTLMLLAGVFVSSWQAIRAQRGEASARAALAELRASAPAFAAQARELVSKGRFSEALDKLDYAIELRRDESDYLIQKGNLLETEFHFGDAAAVYRKALEVQPHNTQALQHLSLCERLQPDGNKASRNWEDTAGELFVLMTAEQRSEAELRRISQFVLNYTTRRLAALGVAGERPVESRLTLQPGKLLGLDLRETTVTDLTALRGLPLESLDLSSSRATNLEPIAELPLTQLNLSGPQTRDLATLRGMQGLRDLSIAYSHVTNLSPLRGRNLRWLDLAGTLITDLSALQGMRLSSLRLTDCPINDLSPLAGMPLNELECAGIPARDFTPIGSCRNLKQLFLSDTGVNTLEPFRNLKLLNLRCDTTSVYDLAPLAGMPLLYLRLYETKVTNITPLLQCPTLRTIGLPPGARDIEGLRRLTNLTRISYAYDQDLEPNESASEFWRKWDGGRAAHP